MKILVTGSANGLGLEIARKLRDCGHEVIDFDVVWGDNVADPNLKHFKNALQDGLDVLINCAGINCNEWFEDITRESLMNVMETNAFSFVYMTQAVMQWLDMLDTKLVINIVSNAAHIPMTSSLAYNASKAAALMITKQMAHELTKSKGYTVFSISPNKLRGTEMSKQIEENVCLTRGWTPEFAAEYQRKALMHGIETEPGAIADLIAGLIRDGGWKYMSGCDIPFGK